METSQRRRGVRFEGIGEADMGRLVENAWPDNVRELEHDIERARGRVTGQGGVAEILGLSPSTASWRIARLGLTPDLLRACQT